MVIHPLAQPDQSRGIRHEVVGRRPRHKQRDVAELVPVGQLVGEQQADVSHPRHGRDVLPRQTGRKPVVDRQDRQDLDDREAVHGDEVDDRKRRVERRALAQPRLGRLGGTRPQPPHVLRDGVHGVPHPAQQRVEDQQEG